MDTTSYSSSAMTFTADNMTFSNVTPGMDGVVSSEDSTALIAELLNSSGGNNTHMSDCDTNKPTLIIITQVSL